MCAAVISATPDQRLFQHSARALSISPNVMLDELVARPSVRCTGPAAEPPIRRR